jgi:outer membrane receptor protein involved in Fe transport
MKRIPLLSANRAYAAIVTLVSVSALALSPAAHGAEAKPLSTTTAAPAQLPPVEVIGTTPLPGLLIERPLVPAPVQTATDKDIQRANSISVTDFMNRNLGGVHINEITGNPFQPDVNYRGFTASPLLGTPQGLSVYMDGVRMNQPFGDVMNWDLIPKSAIASMTLVPGSNPLFGLNTLGGALSIQTKDGRSHPGAALTAYAGNYGRHSGEFEYGAFNQNWDVFVTGTYFKERGWRDDSPTRVAQLFGKLGWRNAATDVKLSLSHANNHLHGNQLQEFRLLGARYDSVYTKPDITENYATLMNLAVNHSVSDNLSLSGNAYYRRIHANTFNGDINEASLDQAVYQPNAAERAALTAAGFRGFPTAGESSANTPFPFWRCIANALLRDEPNEKCNGLINRSSTSQNQWGLSGQFTLNGALSGMKHQFTGGAGWDASSVRFTQSSQFGYLNADRSITPVNAFADGTLIDDNGNPVDARVNLYGRTNTWSVYATDTLSFNRAWHLTLSGRYNRTHVENIDNLRPGVFVRSLNSSQSYQRLNPSAGLSFTPNREFNAFVSYSEGSRAPSSIETGCADPAAPCRLPNSMQGDPPLKAVVTKTVELGAHGTFANGLKWNAGVFRAENEDDILFVAAPVNTQFGYFRNFGKTRRDGFEAGVNQTSGKLSYSANYTWLDATYQSREVLNGAGNSSNSLGGGLEGGTITILPGNHIPLIPRHIFKFHADYAVTGQWTLGGGMQAVGSSYARGNENNLHTPDGRFYLGPGKSGGYAVFNLSTRYQHDRQWSFFAQVSNVLNRQYATSSQISPTGLTAAGNFIARPFGPANNNAVQQSTFLAPGAPRMGWVGVRYQFDTPKKN